MGSSNNIIIYLVSVYTYLYLRSGSSSVCIYQPSLEIYKGLAFPRVCARQVCTTSTAATAVPNDPHCIVMTLNPRVVDASKLDLYFTPNYDLGVYGLQE